MEYKMEYKYPVFNEEAWKFNVNRIFFLFGLGVLYSLIRTIQQNFEITLIDLLGRTFCGWTIILLGVCWIEATLATIVKIALTPGCLLDSKFTVFKVFPKTVGEVFLKYFEGFKLTTTYVTINTSRLYYSNGLHGVISNFTTGQLEITGYLKEPDNFK